MLTHRVCRSDTQWGWDTVLEHQPHRSGPRTEGMRVSLPFVCIALGCISECKYGGRIPKFQAEGGGVGSTLMFQSEQTAAQNIFLTCLIGDAFLKKPL